MKTSTKKHKICWEASRTSELAFEVARRGRRRRPTGRRRQPARRGWWPGSEPRSREDGGRRRSLGARRTAAGEGASVRGGRCPAPASEGGGQPSWGTGGAASGELGAGV